MEAGELMTLIGILVGAGITLFVQMMASRQAQAISLAGQSSALRSDRRDALYGYLEAAQTVDELIDAQMRSSDLVDGMRPAMHKLWFRQKCVDVVGSDRIRKATFQFTDAMNSLAWGHVPAGYEDVWDCMNKEREKFLEAARIELHNPSVTAR